MAKKKNKTISVKTKKPSGLSIVRSGSTVTFKWKREDANYSSGQQLQYKINGGGWKAVSIGTGTVSKSITLSIGNYVPTNKKTAKLKSVAFRVRGQRAKYSTGTGKKKKNYDPTWSDWASASFGFSIPNRPSVSAALNETYDNITTFGYSSGGNSAHQYFRWHQWQTILVKDCNVTDGSKLAWKSSTLGWNTGTNASNGSVTITENASTLANGPYTRWFRVKSRGVAGDSAWSYTKHVYASPAAVTNLSASVTPAQSGYNVTAKWSTIASAKQPVDSVVVQYAFAVPTIDMTAPGGASWTDAGTVMNAKGNEGMTFSVDDTLNEDECLFVRVCSHHDRKVTYSNVAIAAYGYLSDPEDLQVETDDTTFRATVTAENTSQVAGSFLAITYRPTNTEDSFIVGIIPSGTTSVTVQCPDWSQETAVAFGVQAIKGPYTAKQRADGAYTYELEKKMESEATLWEGGAVPLAPANVTANPTDIESTIRVAWDWSWTAANKAILSWSDHEDAWESTDEPSDYAVSNIHAAAWNIAGLETGKTWYVRVRLAKTTGDKDTMGPWSDIIPVDLSSAPSIPSLVLSQGIIPADGSVTASWGYTSRDGMGQAYAEICEATVTGEGITYGEVIARTQTAQHLTINAADVGWESGNTYNLCVRVVSSAGRASDSWSAPASIIIADPITAEIEETSLEVVTVVDDEDQSITRDVLSLTEMPLTVTITGAGAGGTTMLAIERAAPYHLERPDGTDLNGHEGETIVLIEQSGEEEITIEQDDLLGYLDDGAQYRIVATVQDSYGQSDEARLDFEVHWEHQAIMPEATCTIDTDNNVAMITATAPTGTLTGDTFDIYRLSVDRPELIVQNGTWGTVYVDPYPAIGEFGGHRVVFKTVNGDFITAEDQPAWLDLREDEGDLLDLSYSIIDFDGESIPIEYNMDIKTDFEKDFRETKYLGGSVVGDWNPAVSRTGSIDAIAVVSNDQETIQALRRLAVYPGIAHVRSKDGSSYAANVNVSDQISYNVAGKQLSVSLNITRVDPEGFEGLTYDQWHTDEESE